jgi:hypothetical protein
MGLPGADRSATAIVFGAFLLALSVADRALALPKYGQREGSACLVCHVQGTGTGGLTDRGEFYRDNNYSLVGYRPAPAEATRAPTSRAELEQRLEWVERELARLKDALAALPPEQAEEIEALPEPARAPAPGPARAVSIEGYSEFTFEDLGDGDSQFDVLRFVPRISGQLAPDLRFTAEIEFEHLGDVEKGGEIAVEQAVLDYLMRPELNLRAGGLLVPFNQLNILHDGPLRELTSRPLVDRVIVPTTWTEPGVGVHGNLRTRGGTTVNYETYLVNGLGPGISESRGLRSARRRGLDDNNRNKAWVGRVGVVPMSGLEIGVSGYEGKWDDDSRLSLSMVGADWSYRRGAFKFLGEWVQVDVERDAMAIADGVPPELEGYYAEVSYRMGRWTPVIHFSRIDPDTSLVSRYDVDRLVLGLNYRPTDRSMVKVEWQRNREEVDEVSNDGVAASVTHYF